VKVIVCIKQVPDTTNVRINPETNTLVREGVQSIINPFDAYAIEEAVRIKEKHGGNDIVLSMGPPQAAEALREAISLGVDEAVLISDSRVRRSRHSGHGVHPRRGIRKLGGADIVLMGRQAIDGDTGQVGPGVAENLDIPPHHGHPQDRGDRGRRIVVESSSRKATRAWQRICRVLTW